MIKMAETTDVMSIVDLVEKEIDMKLKRKQKEVLEAFMKGHTKTRITDQRITEHGSRFRYRIACHNYYSMVIIFHSTWEPVSRNHFKMTGVCKGAISATEAYFMDDTRLVGNRMIE